MRFFGKPTLIKRRSPGSYVAGKWVEGSMVEQTINATVMPPSSSDYNQVQMLLGGRFPRQAMKAYTDNNVTLTVAGQDQRNGDMVVINGEDFTVVGAIQRTVLGSSVSHNRYLLVAMRELFELAVVDHT